MFRVMKRNTRYIQKNYFKYYLSNCYINVKLSNCYGTVMKLLCILWKSYLEEKIKDPSRQIDRLFTIKFPGNRTNRKKKKHVWRKIKI